MNMDNNKKLELLAREYNATMEHAEKVLNEYVNILIEQVLLEEIERAKQIIEGEMLLISVLGMLQKKQ